MSHLGKHQKVALAVGGIVLVYLIYRHFSGSATSSTAAGPASSSDPSSNDYASLAGQEQGDVAALQNQVAALGGQEGSDVAALQAQEQGDVGGLASQFSGFGDQLAGLTDQLTGMAGSLAQPSAPAQAAGLLPTNRHKATRQRKATQNKHHKQQQGRNQRNQGRTRSTHVHKSPNKHVAPAVHAPHPSHPAAHHNPPAHRPARHPATVGARFTPTRPKIKTKRGR